MKDSKKTLYTLVIAALVLSVIGISIGFAAMSTELTINGTTTVVPATWKIRFQNLSKVTGDDDLIVTAPQITSDTHIGNYALKLTKPGDIVEYKFEVANTGSIDAILQSFTMSDPTITGTGANAEEDARIVTDNLFYSLSYEDGSAILDGDELNKNTSKKVILSVEYNPEATELPTNEVTITGMDVTFLYAQK